MHRQFDYFPACRDFYLPTVHLEYHLLFDKFTLLCSIMIVAPLFLALFGFAGSSKCSCLLYHYFARWNQWFCFFQEPNVCLSEDPKHGTADILIYLHLESWKEVSALLRISKTSLFLWAGKVFIPCSLQVSSTIKNTGTFMTDKCSLDFRRPPISMNNFPFLNDLIFPF